MEVVRNVRELKKLELKLKCCHFFADPTTLQMGKNAVEFSALVELFRKYFELQAEFQKSATLQKCGEKNN